MKLFTEAFLDRWEKLATEKSKRWEEKTPPKWITFFHADWDLLPAERYTLRRYLRQIAFTGLYGVFAVIFGWTLPLMYFWLKYPFVFYDPRYHKPFIGLLSHEGLYLTPWMVLFILIFNGLLWLPQFYFWNRRAERLRQKPPPVSDNPVEVAPIDAGVWPPPPQRPTT